VVCIWIIASNEARVVGFAWNVIFLWNLNVSLLFLNLVARLLRGLEMMTCEKCRCKTHVIYVTRSEGKICGQCRVELVKCQCDESAEPVKEKGQGSPP
jgi:hypothetical protein